jgi:DNA-binding MarR family transcriptional regulator
MKRVGVTDDGRAVIRRLNAARLSGLHEFTQALTDAERSELGRALSHILQRADVAACRLEDPA